MLPVKGPEQRNGSLGTFVANTYRTTCGCWDLTYIIHDSCNCA